MRGLLYLDLLARKNFLLITILSENLLSEELTSVVLLVWWGGKEKSV